MKTSPVDGNEITVFGTLLDGLGEPLRDALVEIWQADAKGNFTAPSKQSIKEARFSGFGRTAVDLETGGFSFETVKPGRVRFSDGRLQAPHITFWIAARGINVGLHTRMYFDDEPDANAEDPVLALVSDRDRVSTLMAVREGAGKYRFDIRLQGERETIFFDV